MSAKIFTVLVLAALFNINNGAKILVVFPTPGTSHYMLGNAYTRGLVEAGHEVTLVSPFEEKNKPKNGKWRDIVLTGVEEEFQKMLAERNQFDMDTSSLLVLGFFHYLGLGLTENILVHPNMQKLIKSGETFDVVVVEQFINDAHKALATHFKAPLIIFSSVAVNNWINPFIGNPAPPSYISDMSKSYPTPMTFYQRLINTITTELQAFFVYYFILPKHGKLIKKYISEEIDYQDVFYNASLVLANGHASINEPVPFVPGVIDIAGFHVKPPKKLPEDLQKYLDGAKEGVVYFSMGSNLKSKNLPKEKRDAILNIFSRLKLQVLWKWEDDNLPGKPANVKTSKWLPQSDILAHPNIKLFITHGGYLSTTEAVYHGIPLVAIPVYGDQATNARNIQNHGFGRAVSFKELTEEKLEAAILEVLNNPKYAENAKVRSKVFHDRQVKPLDKAVFWTEYVIRHKGAPHLRVAGVDLPLYQYLLLDVWAVIVGSVLSFIYVAKKLVCRLCRKKKTDKKKKE